MTDADLLTAIDADTQAKALADAGDDAGCANRLRAVLPPVLVSRDVTERGVYQALGPAAAEAFLQGLEAVAAGDPTASPPRPGNPVVARALKWLEPAQGGLDVGSAATRAEIDQIVAAGAITADSAATVKALGEGPAPVSAADVSRVYLGRRPEGKVS